jgi:hypothetical protein
LKSCAMDCAAEMADRAVGQEIRVARLTVRDG